MSSEYLKGFAVGIVAVFVCVAIGILIGKLIHKENKGRYDERQQKERGRAFKVGFIAYVICTLSAMFLDAYGVTAKIEQAYIYLMVLLVPLLVFVLVCIWRDAYFQMGENKKRFFIFGVFALILNVLGFIQNRNNISLIACAFLIITFLNIIAKVIVEHFKEKKLTDEDEAITGERSVSEGK